jgi:hypothetical protein
MAAYTYAIVGMLAAADLWTVAQLKDTVLWFVVSGIALVFAAVDGAKQANFWAGTVVDQLKALVFLEYLAAESSWSLPVELIVFPVLVGMAMMQAVAGMRKEHKALAKVLAFVLGAVTLAIVADGIGVTAGRIAVGETREIGRSLMLAPVLTVLSIPYLYVYMLAVLYDELLWRIAYRNPGGKRFARQAASRIMFAGHLRLFRLHTFLRANALPLLGLADKAALDELLSAQGTARLSDLAS